jgi:hypothetical protein
MTMQDDNKDPRGRSYDQVTKGGSTSSGSLGADGTGNVVGAPRGNEQWSDAVTRTDDLLSNDAERDSGGYVGEEAGELQTGMGGIGSLSTGNAGSRQSSDNAASDSKQQPPGGQRSQR